MTEAVLLLQLHHPGNARLTTAVGCLCRERQAESLPARQDGPLGGMGTHHNLMACILTAFPDIPLVRVIVSISQSRLVQIAGGHLSLSGQLEEQGAFWPAECQSLKQSPKLFLFFHS